MFSSKFRRVGARNTWSHVYSSNQMGRGLCGGLSSLRSSRAAYCSNIKNVRGSCGASGGGGDVVNGGSERVGKKDDVVGKVSAVGSAGGNDGSASKKKTKAKGIAAAKRKIVDAVLSAPASKKTRFDALPKVDKKRKKSEQREKKKVARDYASSSATEADDTAFAAPTRSRRAAGNHSSSKQLSAASTTSDKSVPKARGLKRDREKNSGQIGRGSVFGICDESKDDKGDKEEEDSASRKKTRVAKIKTKDKGVKNNEPEYHDDYDGYNSNEYDDDDEYTDVDDDDADYESSENGSYTD